jgi:AAA15 family ATPase/GTPase
VNLIKARNGVALFDEIENGLHYSVLEDIWTAIAEAARQNNSQVFATTHSLECIHAFYHALKKQGKDDFSYCRLDSRENDRVAVGYDSQNLEASFDINLEVR